MQSNHASSKYHAKWQILVPNCCKYKANGTRKENQKNIQNLSKKQKLLKQLVENTKGLERAINLVWHRKSWRREEEEEEQEEEQEEEGEGKRNGYSQRDDLRHWNKYLCGPLRTCWASQDKIQKVFDYWLQKIILKIRKVHVQINKKWLSSRSARFM